MNMHSLLQTDLLLQVSGMTSGRAATILPMVLGLISVVTGWLAIARSAAVIRPKRLVAIIALVVALIGISLGAVHLARATGDIGTGSGRLGAIVAVVLSLVGLILGGLTLIRSRQNTTGRDTRLAASGRKKP